jgi:hypothetical protein
MTTPMAKHNLALTSCLASTAFVACFAGCATYAAPDHLDLNGGAGGASAGGSAGAATAAGTGGAQGTAGAPNGGTVGVSGAAGQSAANGGSGGGGAAGASSGGVGGGASGASSGGAGANGGGAGGQTGVPPNAIEAISVPASGATVASKASLDNGELYLLKATGTVSAGGVAIDAEYGDGQDLVSGTDVGVDVGFKVERTPSGTTAGRKKWFGAYRADHTYYVVVTGAGAPMSIKLVLPTGSTATGALTLALMRLSPTATVLAPALETVLANVNKPTVHSTMMTTASVVYLLQATGQGKTGGNNLGMGDADWMDYDVNGNGKVDIGDQSVDYGLGVDEATPASTMPRKHWWGPWRKDHSYYMLFAGTGSTIGFTYYDVGDYGDNSATDKITVHVFPVP